MVRPCILVFIPILLFAPLPLCAAHPLSVAGTLERLPDGVQGQVILVKGGRFLPKNPELAKGDENAFRLALVTMFLIQKFFPEVEKRLQEDIDIARRSPTNLYMNVFLEKERDGDVKIRAFARRGISGDSGSMFSIGLSFDVDIFLNLNTFEEIRIRRRF